MTLLNHIHNEYVDEDRMAKKEVINRTYNLIRAFQDERKPKTAGQQTLMYQFDQLFNDFRNSVEGILREDLDANQNLNKSFEIIKKYNNLASFIQNMIKINTLPEQDEQLIQARFKDIEPLLNELVAIANESGFIDRGELSAMVSRIKSLNFTQVSASEKDNMMSKIANKNDIIQMLTNAQSNILPSIKQTIDQIVNDPVVQNQTDATLKAQFDKTIQDIIDAYDQYEQNFSIIDPTKFKAIFSNTSNDDEKAVMKVMNEFKSQYGDLLQFHESVQKTLATFKQIDDNRLQTIQQGVIYLNNFEKANENAFQDTKIDADNIKKYFDAIVKEYTDLSTTGKDKVYQYIMARIAVGDYNKLAPGDQTPAKQAEILKDIMDGYAKDKKFRAIPVAVGSNLIALKKKIEAVETEMKTLTTEMKAVESDINDYNTTNPTENDLKTHKATMEKCVLKIQQLKKELDDISLKSIKPIINNTIPAPDVSSQPYNVAPPQPQPRVKNVKTPKKPAVIQVPIAKDIIDDYVNRGEKVSSHFKFKALLSTGTPDEKKKMWDDYKQAWNLANPGNKFK